MRTRVAALTMGMVLAAATTVHAADEKIAVAPVEVDGGDQAFDAAVFDAVVAGLSGPGRVLVRSDQACRNSKCFASLAEMTGASLFVHASVGVRGSDFSVSISTYDETGRRVDGVEFTCEICTRPELQARLSREAAALLPAPEGGAPDADPEAPATVTVTSKPDADVLLDGQKVGRTPYTGEVSPGRHSLTVRADGYRPETTEFAAKPDRENALAFSLERDKDGASRRRRGLAIGGYVTLAAGLGATAAGGVLLGLNNKPVKGRCSGDSIDVNGECEFLHDTLTVGAVLTSVGVAAVVTGIALAVVGRKRGASSRNRAAVTVGGVRF